MARCGCGYQAQGDTQQARIDDLRAHLRTCPPLVITDLREIFPAEVFGGEDEPGAADE